MSKQKLNEDQLRQGDVLLVRVGDAKEVAAAHKPLVLKEGEATGHKHQFMAEARVSFLGREPGREKLFVGAPSSLRHEEHLPATVLPGVYEMPTQVEWTDENEPRVVAD